MKAFDWNRSFYAASSFLQLYTYMDLIGKLTNALTAPG